MVVSSSQEMPDAIDGFYKNLFSKSVTDPGVQDLLLSKCHARLSPEERKDCEAALRLPELDLALSQMQSGKTPGLDGITADFYKQFWHLLGWALVQVFDSSFLAGFLPKSTTTSHIRLAFKKGDRKDLKNWRPISLLNVDCKIIAKALSLRLSRVLSSVVHPDQTCWIPGRCITDNLVLLRDISAYTDATNETGILVGLDQEKAFDRVDCGFLDRFWRPLVLGSIFALVCVCCTQVRIVK
jgi:hypothetical protein